MNDTRRRRKSALREVWDEYRRSPRGMIGLFLFLIFLFIGVGAPWLTPYDPIQDRGLADAMARPAWMRIFPKYKNAPVTVDALSLHDWQLIEEENIIFEWGERNEQEVMHFLPAGEGSSRFVLEYGFNYQSDPPDTFIMQVPYSFRGDPGVTGQATIEIVDPEGNVTLLWESRVLRNEVRWTTQRIDSRDFQIKTRLGLRPLDNLAARLIDKHGDYRFLLTFTVDGADKEGAATVTVGETRFRIPGQLHGPLGTDNLGSDLWAQFVYGTRTSLVIGFIVAALAVILGTTIGIVSGYVGRWLDELLMRTVDVLISIPFLPVMIVIVAIVGKSIGTLIFLVAIFSWMGIARLVRSQTLTLRERTFVEAARAAGASPWYIMRAHILPNVLGIVFASLVLLIPGAIITEASLSFLGFGDPRVPTWGKILQTAKTYGAFPELAWWWILPPGLALTILALAFVFIGNTIDDILNRRSSER